MAAPAEDHLIAWLRREMVSRWGEDPLGDDTAWLAAPPGNGWVVTTDSQIAGVHQPVDLDPYTAGHRLVLVNLSDLAAAGATPAAAQLALAAPPGYDFRRFFRGVLDACQLHGLRLSGGDLARSPHLHAVMTLLGTLPPGHAPNRRGLARPGDGLWVGGTLGESAAGCRLLARGARLAGAGPGAHIYLPAELRTTPELDQAARAAVRRHLAPTPQLALGAWLRGLRKGGEPPGRPGSAVMDLSDGLARDLPRLAAASDVGARVDATALPRAAQADELAVLLGTTAQELALGGGEDYVLLFTLPPGQTPPAGFGGVQIGQMETRNPDQPPVWLNEGGTRCPWPDTGWDHLEPDPPR